MALDEAWKADSGEFHRVVVTPAEASAMGAGAICMYLIGGPATGEMFAGNVAAVAKAAREADRVGHEVSGTIAELGGGVEGYEVGTLCGVSPIFACGVCR